MTTLSGRSTAIARGARVFRSSRTKNSSRPMSTMFSRLATPISSANRRIGLGRVAAAANAADRRHARIVPPAHVLLVHELQQLPLAHDGVVQVQARKLDLLRLARQRQVVHEPVVQRPVILELERADRMRDALDRVRDRMRVVVHRVDAPRVARPVMMRATDAIQNRVAHVDVGRRHVDLRAQHARRRPETRPRASGGTGRDSPQPRDRDTGSDGQDP